MTYARHEPIPDNFPVRPISKMECLAAKCCATCGHCGLSWDDAIGTELTPAPAGRCPFEYFHIYDEEDEGFVTITLTKRQMAVIENALYNFRDLLDEKVPLRWGDEDGDPPDFEEVDDVIADFYSEMERG